MTDPSAPQGSTKYALVEAKLDRPLADYLRDNRARGESFLNMAFSLTALTGVKLTQEIVRQWVRDQEARERREPSVLKGHAHHSLGREAPAA